MRFAKGWESRLAMTANPAREAKPVEKIRM